MVTSKESSVNYSKKTFPYSTAHVFNVFRCQQSVLNSLVVLFWEVFSDTTVPTNSCVCTKYIVKIYSLSQEILSKDHKHINSCDFRDIVLLSKRTKECSWVTGFKFL